MACPAFSLFVCPLSPQPPSPAGKGGDLRLFYARGFAPCIPGAEPGRHRFALPLWKTQCGLAPADTCSPCPGGEDHLKRRRRLRRIVPLPRSPLSLAAGTVHQSRVSTATLPPGIGTPPPAPPRKGRSPTPGTYLAGSVSAASGLMPGVPGAEPPAK